jgi:hypothetical protein
MHYRVFVVFWATLGLARGVQWVSSTSAARASRTYGTETAVKNLHKTLSNLALLGALGIAGCATSERAPFVSRNEVSDSDENDSASIALDDSDDAEQATGASWARLAAVPLTATVDEPSALTEEQPDEPAVVESEEEEATSSANFFVYLTATPAQFDQVWVDIADVEISTTGGDAGAATHTMQTPRTIDLLTLESAPTILGDAELQPGSYAKLRLFLSDPKIVSGNEYLPVFMPLAVEQGIEIDLDFEIEAGVAYSLVLDFDAFSSIQEDGLGLHMRPVIRVESFTATGDGNATAGDESSPDTTSSDEKPEAAPLDAGAPAVDAGAEKGE